MGEQFLATPGSRPQLSITDPKLCRSFLVGTCPHDLFTNTKQDLGPCHKTHNDALKAEYEAADAAQKARWGFEFDYLRHMQDYVEECNRRIEVAHRRLEKTPEEIRQTNYLLRQIAQLSASIETGLVEIRVMAEQESAVNLAAQVHFRLRQAKMQKEEKERELRNLADTSGPSGHQKLQVCDVCGAYLSRLDNDRRLADHFYGKMHLGYAQMRKTHQQLQMELKGRAPPQRQESSGRDGDPYDRSYRRGGGGPGGGGPRGGRGGGGRRRW